MKPEVVSRNVNDPLPGVNIPRLTFEIGRKEVEVPAADKKDATNPTLLPTPFWRNVTPILLFRPPALVFEAILRLRGLTMEARIDDEEFPVEASLHRLRILYEWFDKSAVSHVRPIVLNADKIMKNPTIVHRLCEQLRLDPKGLAFEWNALPPSTLESQSSYQHFCFWTEISSCGVLMETHPAIMRDQELDLNTVTAKWQKTHGMETAAVLRSFVDAAMPDYEYLCLRETRL